MSINLVFVTTEPNLAIATEITRQAQEAVEPNDD